ncbi:replication-relaxation family protein [Parvibaculum sp.]|uniref:replication-relaxation family protein n=1 Tax=Parvibaculum sp. TaxID=2024848 RepID=UPI001D212C16|nr:replication-relaxation family protein [Parvibaculum sp.]MBX3490334.1 replication-relaxation family protein [Parvibaculum sp.]
MTNFKAPDQLDPDSRRDPRSPKKGKAPENLRAERRLPAASIAAYRGMWRTFSALRHDAIASGMEHRKRRSRMKRQKTDKRLALTARDLAIFELLERYRYLRSTFIHAFVGGASETRFKERLGDLYHEGGYLNRPEQQWETAHSRYLPAIYENSNRAREVLAAHGKLAEPCPHMPYGAGAGRQFVHSLMICEVLAAIELATVSDPNLRFIAWPEILAKAPKATRNDAHPMRLPVSARLDKTIVLSREYVVPDGLFGLEYRMTGERSYRFFALEIDRGTMPIHRSNALQSSFSAKLRAYRDIAERDVHKSRLGIPNLLILTVTSSETRKDNMMSTLSNEAGRGAMFLFKAVADLSLPAGRQDRARRVRGELWERSGHPALDIFSDTECQVERDG